MAGGVLCELNIMNYCQIYYIDIANGTGCRTSLFVSGCTHHCKECFNEETWDFDYGNHFTKEVEDRVIESLKPDYIDGLTLLGGEPMEKANQPGVAHLLRRIKKEVSRATIWIYSGYTYEELIDPKNPRCRTDATDEILQLADILVDGEFDYTKKDITLKFRGSSNQRIIDLRATFLKGQVVISQYSN